ncbi:uncharacterized protein LTR77_004968 [Saxophila tyrrhenica]|uniref:SET domain-containing protein n=1 Tax=Saxophila tyrrhenica TaxID=1690608 RepID=A0AAV9PB22_9PEZI|nr:hypothetical protein LTR77_004968 [Saxophila tyrrhenica]
MATMIRRGKTEGWLRLPPGAFLPWAALNDAQFYRTAPGNFPGRGGALLAEHDLDAEKDDSNVLLTVPKDLVLSLERCQEQARYDRDYREVLDSLGDFSKLSEYVGVHTAFSDYIKSLPMEELPTFWTPEELQLLIGTTLAPAMSSKLKSLRREYDLLCSSAANTRWYKAVQDYLDFDDWLQVDAMYRSRALDFPAIGHCMVPCVDLANHATGESTLAVYEKDHEGNAVLLLRDGKSVKDSHEITITYGDEKGACEMLFSYGFLDDSMTSAESLFLSLNIADTDSQQTSKMKFADTAPGFKLIDTRDSEIDWTGDFIWLLCLSEDDGLRFELARTVDGDIEMEAFFHDRRLTGGAAELYSLLAKDELWELYRLRAITLLQQRVFDQLQVLFSTQDDMEATPHGDNSEVRDRPYELAMRLRALEFDLMNQAYESFEQQKDELAQHPVVVRYLEEMNQETSADSQADPGGTVAEPDDFS